MQADEALGPVGGGGKQRGANWLPTTPGSRKLFIREAETGPSAEEVLLAEIRDLLKARG